MRGHGVHSAIEDSARRAQTHSMLGRASQFIKTYGCCPCSYCWADFLLLLRRARALTASSQHTVLRTFTELAPVEIVRAWGARELYDSLILANVARMAKYGRVSHSARPDDGLFEVVCCRHGARWRIALMALRAALVGLGNQPRVSQFGFRHAAVGSRPNRRGSPSPGSRVTSRRRVRAPWPHHRWLGAAAIPVQKPG